MKRTCLWQKGTRLFSILTVLFGQSLAPMLTASAADYNNKPNCCPPNYRYSPSYRHPTAPGTTPTTPRSDGTMPETTPGTTPDTTTSPSDTAQQQQQDTTQQPQFSDPSASSSSLASLAPGANTPMLGRADQSNRFNLFDNMSAAPANRVWFGLQYVDSFGTGLTQAPEFYSYGSSSIDSILSSNLGITTGFFVNSQVMYRVGAEYAMYDDFSVAVQGQYVATGGTGNSSDDWDNPQIFFKYVLASDVDTVVSATFGITPDIGTNVQTVNEDTTKLYPGMLYYETLGRDLFTQGGFQFGIPTSDDQITTFDWSVSLGYWLYRGNTRDNSPIAGIIPQINLLGKHVIGDPTVTGAFGFSADPITISGTTFANGLLLYDEPNDVVDLSVGTAVVLDSGLQFHIGYSFPLSDNSVRENELLSAVNYVY